MDSYGNTYDRGVGKLPSTYSKKTMAMAVLPVITLPPKPSGQNSLPGVFATPSPSPAPAASPPFSLAQPALLSRGKPASLSSGHPGGFPANYANDGDKNNFAHSSCNLDGSGPWWGVDLQGAKHARMLELVGSLLRVVDA